MAASRDGVRQAMLGMPLQTRQSGQYLILPDAIARKIDELSAGPE